VSIFESRGVIRDSNGVVIITLRIQALQSDSFVICIVCMHISGERKWGNTILMTLTHCSKSHSSIRKERKERNSKLKSFCPYLFAKGRKVGAEAFVHCLKGDVLLLLLFGNVIIALAPHT